MKTREVLLLIILLLCSSMAITVLAQEAPNSITPLPEKAKLKTIKYKNYDYAIVGYVYEKQFIEGQIISFYNTSTQSDKVSFGYISVPYSKTNLSNQMISGTYFVREGISYLDVTFADTDNFIQGLFKVSNTHDGNGLSPNHKEARKLNIEPVNIIQCSGYNRSGDPVFLQKNSNDYVLKIELDDSNLEVSITSDYMEKNFYSSVSKLFKYRNAIDSRYEMPLDFDDYIKNSENVKLTYQNGDIFLGQIENSKGKYRAKEGKYTFSNGEIFTGTLNDYSSEIWTNGMWIFTDGNVENGDWLKKYNVTKDNLASVSTMTEKHSLAIQLYEQRQKRIMEEKIARLQSEEKKRVADQKRKQEYILKYGEYYGTLVSQGELRAGMSTAMVNAVFPKDFFIISESTRNGQSVEIWQFSKDKMETAIMLEGAKNKEEGVIGALATAFLIALSEQMGGPTIPRMLIFKNNKLTDIYR